MNDAAQHIVTADEHAQMDAWYMARGENGRPSEWGTLVNHLRSLRRLIEAGTIVIVDDRRLRSVGSFLEWADEHYHALEDGYDLWIGHDLP